MNDTELLICIKTKEIVGMNVIAKLHFHAPRFIRRIAA